ncbi:MAG: mechanosensitive ion channel family protein [Helicobacteraceae bacterium]|jgi:small-conductance mechanosensitive channel|nr:mechanosensitive ion channel family protein [Helicobacteraceae bacterium]
MFRIVLVLILFAGSLLCETLNEIKTDYFSNSNIWIKTYKNQREINELKNKISLLTEEINALKGQDTRIKNEELMLLKAQLESLVSAARSFLDILDVTSINAQTIEINLISFLTNSKFRELERARTQIESLKKDYEKAIAYIEETAKKTENIIEIEHTNEAKEFLKLIEEDLHILLAAKGVIDQKEESINILFEIVASKTRHYKDSDFAQLIVNISIAIGVLAALYIIRFLLTRFSGNEERSAFWIRLSNLLAALSIALFLLFNYIDNLIDALTFVGFMAAGLTIVHKEVLLNIAAWFQMAFSSSIQVGDRILLYFEATPIIGDVIAISPMKITLYEEITHNNAAELKRAGRILFIPTNFIFSKVIYNYTHESMKTIYDLIEITLDINSDFDRVKKITEEVVFRITSRYIEMAKYQYKKLQDKYILRGKDMSPRIQFMMPSDKKGIVMYLWYVAPYREILGCRSDLTLELIKRFKKEADIFLIDEEKNKSA